LATVLAAPALAVGIVPAPARTACEPYVDTRELRYREPAMTVTGHVVDGTVKEPNYGKPEFGQQLILGTADIIAEDSGKRILISYAYWNTIDGCGRWGPAQGGRYVFDLANDGDKDGSLRVMRYGPAAP
jgi:hypothetical protein